MELEGPPVTFGFFGFAVYLKFSAPACTFAQPPHHRFFPSAASPNVGCLRPQPSHIFCF
jgi:hypothetical protein